MIVLKPVTSRNRGAAVQWESAYWSLSWKNMGPEDAVASMILDQWIWNHGKTMGKSWEHHGNIRGKSWENHGKIMKTWKYRKTCHNHVNIQENPLKLELLTGKFDNPGFCWVEFADLFPESLLGIWLILGCGFRISHPKYLENPCGSMMTCNSS